MPRAREETWPHKDTIPWLVGIGVLLTGFWSGVAWLVVRAVSARFGAHP
jgi:cytochrome c oxidase assembly factor CtaG